MPPWSAGRRELSIAMATGCRLDHIAVTAPDLDRGAAYVSDILGVAPAGGGEHALMATHNRLLRLADTGCRLRRLELRHPDAARVEALLRSIGFDDDRVVVAALPAGAPPRVVADIDTPGGPRQLG